MFMLFSNYLHSILYLQVQHNGLTGQIMIKNGLRQSVDLKIMRLNPTGKFIFLWYFPKITHEEKIEQLCKKLISTAHFKKAAKQNYIY